MNQLFIRDVVFDWADVDEDSYLKDIPSLYGLDKSEFENHNFISGYYPA